MPPSVRSIRQGDDNEFTPEDHPFRVGNSSFGEGLDLAQRQIDRHGNLVGHFPNIRQEGNRAVDDRSWWERNSGWLIPAMMLAGPTAAGAAFGPAAAAGAGAAGGGSAASSIPLGVGPTTFGAGSAAGTAAAGLTPGLLAENAALGGAYGAGTAGAAGAGASGARGATNALSSWLNPRTLAGLGLGAAGAIQGLRQPAGMGQLQDLFDMSMRRSEQAQPLYDQLIRMTQAQLPDYTRQG